MKSNGTSRISLRDIAKRLGVSHVTVSLALRDNPRISQSMREKVKAVAEEMSYRPDPMLAALANYRKDKRQLPVTSSIAWINAWPEPDQLRNHREFDLHWEGVQEAALKHGYRLEEFRQQGAITLRRLDQILSSRGIKGILIPPHTFHPEWSDFPWKNYCVVKFGRSITDPAAHIVTANEVSNTLLAYHKIKQRGYKRIGYIADEERAFEALSLFEAGYLFAQREDSDSNLLPILNIQAHRVYENLPKIHAWMKEYRPDAIITDVAAIPLMLPQYYPPSELGIAATSIMDCDADAGIDQNAREIGRVAFRVLNTLMHERSKGIPEIPHELLVSGKWVDGNSLPDKRL